MMKKETIRREYFLDSIRACLMLLGIPFHLSLIYSSHHWAVNSAESSTWITFINNFIHAFRMQVFFVISGYFSCMLYQRYSPRHWLKIRSERVAIPMMSAIILLNIPQFWLLKNLTSAIGNWTSLTAYQHYNSLVWNLISHTWFLLVLIILTLVSLVFFRLRLFSHRLSARAPVNRWFTWHRLTLLFLLWTFVWCAIRRLLVVFHPALLMDGLFNFAVMQTLFYLPFFMLGAAIWNYPEGKRLFVKFNPWTLVASCLALGAYLLNQRFSSGDGWLYEWDTLITMMMGLWMTNVIFCFGHTLLNSHSSRIIYLVNASLFIYLVHHPLTLIYGIFITPLISNNTLGFLAGLIFVFGIAFLLYEAHLRIPFLRFLFSGKATSSEKSPVAPQR